MTTPDEAVLHRQNLFIVINSIFPELSLTHRRAGLFLYPSKDGAAVQQETAVAALGALAQDTRLKAFRLLVEAGPKGRPAGAIAEALGVPAPTLSFHLAQLSHGGLILQRRDGRLLIYSANFAAMNALVAYLTENCCGAGASVPVACVQGESCDEPSDRRATGAKT
jgi:ArsR family transcriptional regulator, arsenate/arsenite/antimonite-responsive transcriptional repressor